MRLLFFLFLFVSVSQAKDRIHFVSGLHESDAFREGFDFQKSSPLEFLELLKTTDWVVSIHGFHHGWLREEDVAMLIPHMASQEACAPVVSTISSHLPQGRSTVGHEAALLIEGYRNGRYPNFLSSDRALDTVKEVRDLETWCQEFKSYWEKRAHPPVSESP